MELYEINFSHSIKWWQSKCYNCFDKSKLLSNTFSSTGGFLKAGNTTIIVGTEDENVEHVIELIGQESKKRVEVVPSSASYDLGRFSSFPVEVEVGGATIFVLDIEQFLKL